MGYYANRSAAPPEMFAPHPTHPPLPSWRRDSIAAVAAPTVVGWGSAPGALVGAATAAMLPKRPGSECARCFLWERLQPRCSQSGQGRSAPGAFVGAATAAIPNAAGKIGRRAGGVLRKQVGCAARNVCCVPHDPPCGRVRRPQGKAGGATLFLRPTGRVGAEGVRAVANISGGAADLFAERPHALRPLNRSNRGYSRSHRQKGCSTGWADPTGWGGGG